MIRILIIPILLIALFFMRTASGENLQTGKAAFDKGDYVIALEIFKPLAAQEEAQAQYYLGIIYSEGRDIPHDYVRAYVWFNIAAAIHGHQEAVTALDRIAGQMSKEQISQAQQRTTQCMASDFQEC